MVPPDFEERLTKTSNGERLDINCHATTFYLLGLHQNEILVDINAGKDAATLLKRFEIIARAQVPVIEAPSGVHAFVIWNRGKREKGSYWHSGIVHPEDNKMIIHRVMPGTPVIVEPMENILRKGPFSIKTEGPVELQFLRLKDVDEKDFEDIEV